MNTVPESLINKDYDGKKLFDTVFLEIYCGYVIKHIIVNSWHDIHNIRLFLIQSTRYGKIVDGN